MRLEVCVGLGEKFDSCGPTGPAVRLREMRVNVAYDPRLLWFQKLGNPVVPVLLSLASCGPDPIHFDRPPEMSTLGDYLKKKKNNKNVAHLLPRGMRVGQQGARDRTQDFTGDSSFWDIRNLGTNGITTRIYKFG